MMAVGLVQVDVQLGQVKHGFKQDTQVELLSV